MLLAKNLSLLFILSVLVLFGCESNTPEKYNFLEQCSDADSAFNYYQRHKHQLHPGVLGGVSMNLAARGKNDELEKLFQLRKAGFDQLSYVEQAFYLMDYATFKMSENPDSAIIYLTRIPSKIINSSDTVSVAYHQILGHYYYQKNLLDSSVEVFNLGLASAMEIGDTLNMGRIATSLGGLQSILGYEQSAIEYLMRAVSYDPKNLVLANNLASVLTGQKQYKKALEILNEHKDKLYSKYPGNEEKMFRLTYIHLMQEMGNWNDARFLLDNFKLKEVPKTQLYNYHSFWLLQLEHDDKSKVSSYLDQVANDNGEEGYSELFYYLSGWATRMPMANIHAHFQRNLSKLDTSVFDYMSYSVYYDILSQKSRAAGNAMLAANYSLKSSDYLKQHYSQVLEAKELDLLNRLNLYKLEKKYATTRLETENIKLLSKRKSLILAFVTILLVGISIVWYRQNRLNSRNESLTQDLFVQKQRELEILEREKETSKKLVELSARILETSKNLKSKLNHLPEKNLPGIRESLEDLDYILFLNQSVDTTVIASGYDFSKIEFLGDLIESQKNVLNLSLDSYRPKEIAVTLNLSYSYVRNVQSRLRKVLKDNGFETFEDLKKHLDA